MGYIIPGKRHKAGLAGPQSNSRHWGGGEHLPPQENPSWSASCQSLYQLSYPAPSLNVVKRLNNTSTEKYTIMEDSKMLLCSKCNSMQLDDWVMNSTEYEMGKDNAHTREIIAGTQL